MVRASRKYLASDACSHHDLHTLSADAAAVAVGAQSQIRFAYTGDRLIGKQSDLLERLVLEARSLLKLAMAAGIPYPSVTDRI